MTNDVYWWNDAPPTRRAQAPVAPACDAVIVGAGYTGLSAAITLARAGRSVQVFDKDRPGEGASTRNGGITSGNIRPSFAEMSRRFGEPRATAILAEAKVAREDLYRFIAEEKIDCDFALSGRFSGASAPEDYERLAREAERLQRTLGIESYAVPRSEQRSYLGTDLYHGGSVRMDTGGLHPAKLHAEMLRVALAAGATVHGETAVIGVRGGGAGYEVETARGRVQARDVIVGTNGYTDRSDRWPAAPPRAGAQPHHRDGAALPEPHGRADAAPDDVQRYPEAQPLLPSFAGRAADPLRRPRWVDLGRPHMADRQPATRPRRDLSGTGRRRRGAKLVRARCHEPGHDPPDLHASGQALRGGILRIGRGVGPLGGPEGGAAGHGRGVRSVRA